MKKRSLIKLISVAAAVATTAISATTLMVNSYNEYQEYYEKIQAENIGLWPDHNSIIFVDNVIIISLGKEGQ